ncbi:MAG TPA: type VI secretion system membrane subunit TssM [Burkholderiaceae bacterium]|nr:type VI secretion system membrane subunit TssM [Burkholderiaceae bacterium]
MARLLSWLTDARVLAAIGITALAAFLFVGARTLRIAAVWAAIVLAVALLVLLGVWLYRRWRAQRQGGLLGRLIERQARDKQDNRRAEVEALRGRLVTAIKTIKTSKLGDVPGAAALYELPWYLIIGNPAAGKSSAVVHSGLQFPFADQLGSVVQGAGGTRNCDWFFTSEGILLDTAGRYAVHEEDRTEWLGFLDLLKRYRPKAPINGLVIAASIAELSRDKPETVIELAKNLRQRVQEIVERLEVIVPVYVIFTKADLIPGFTEFFEGLDRSERGRVWGASLAYDRDGRADSLNLFDERFEGLYEGLKESSLATMAMHRGERMQPGMLTFPVEFASIKPVLRSFIATLFEDNPFQFKPVFRGFYFTSALHEGASMPSSSQRIADRFGLQLDAANTPPSTVYSKNGFFLLDLFRKVVFADSGLVRQYTSRRKQQWRYAAFLGVVLALGLALGGFSWSYLNNQRLVANATADLETIKRLQDTRIDLQSRFEALGILQDRIEQLERYHDSVPVSLGLGLYQGRVLERKLRDEYFHGAREILVKPAAAALEAFLQEVHARADQLQPQMRTSEQAANSAQLASGSAYKDSSPTDSEDAYNALKTYLMLSDRERAEAGHLIDQLTRFWRGWLETNRGAMTRDQMIRGAERLISFYTQQIADPAWPTTQINLSLVEQTREHLQRVVRGLPARDRVYADIKARAATRFAPITVARIVGEQDKDVVVGSVAISGTFSREAWEGYVEQAIKDAANKELQSSDWVLKTGARDDLTLEGSPEQIQKNLVAQYKADYAREWRKFLQGVTIAEFTSFARGVELMNRLGDPQNSPIATLLVETHRQTSWDNPSFADMGAQRAKRGLVEWFKQVVLGQAPTGVNVSIQMNAPRSDLPLGPVGKEFESIARLVAAKDKDQSLLRYYLDALSKIRTRFNQIKNQGDPGPGAKQLMQQTLEANGSELADALKLVDEQMLNGSADAPRQALRPLLVRPLLQAFAAIGKPTETELNKIWTAQVYEPYQRSIAGKYPFSAESRVEATQAEIAQIFGPEGAVAKYVTTAMGPLVARRGDLVTPRTWGDVGIVLSADFTNNVPRWIAPLSAQGGASAGGAAASEAQTVFQIQPLPAPGTSEYTLEIDGQQLRYRNTPPQWSNFVWPNPQGVAGARVTAITFDGRTIEVANEPGRFGLERLINTAQRKRKDNGVFELSWSAGSVTVSVDLRVISSPQVSGDNAQAPQGPGLRGLKLPTFVAGDSGPVVDTTTPAIPTKAGGAR